MIKGMGLICFMACQSECSHMFALVTIFLQIHAHSMAAVIAASISAMVNG